jgi:hypothetical protein
MIDHRPSAELSEPLAKRLDQNFFVLLGTQAVEAQDNADLLAKRDNAGWELAQALVDPVLSEAAAERIESNHQNLQEVPDHAVYAYWSIAKKAGTISERAVVPTSFLYLIGNLANNSDEPEIAFDATIPGARLHDTAPERDTLVVEESEEEPVEPVDLLIAIAEYNGNRLESAVTDALNELKRLDPVEFRSVENVLTVYQDLPDKVHDHLQDKFHVLSSKARQALATYHDLALLEEIGDDLVMLYDFIEREAFLGADGISAATSRQDAMRLARDLDLGDYVQLKRDLFAGKFKTQAGREAARDELAFSSEDSDQID